MNWELAPHACRHCFGRIVRAGPVYRCATCGVQTSSKPAAICGCGIRPDKAKTVGTYRCDVNPKPSARSPAEIVIFFGDILVEPERL